MTRTGGWVNEDEGPHEGAPASPNPLGMEAIWNKRILGAVGALFPIISEIMGSLAFWALLGAHFGWNQKTYFLLRKFIAS